MFNTSFSLRLISVLILIQVVSFFSLYGVVIYQSYQQQRANWQENSRQQSLLLAMVLVTPQRLEQRPLVLSTLENARDISQLRYAAVLNDRLELLASLGQPPPLAQPLGPFQYREQWQGDLLAIEQPLWHSGQIIGLLQVGYQMPTRYGTVQPKLMVIGTGLISLLLIALTVWWAHRAAHRSLAQLHQGLSALLDNNLDYRLTTNPLSPVASLVNTFNTAVITLQTRLDIIQAEVLELRQQAERLIHLNRLLDHMKAVRWEADPKTGQFTYVSPNVQSLLGYAPEQWIGTDFCANYVRVGDDRDYVNSLLRDTSGTHRMLDFRLIQSDGRYRWLRIFSTSGHRNGMPILMGSLLDIENEKDYQWKADLGKNYDKLTKLINREALVDRLDFCINQERIKGALLYIDLDQFKYINDSYGHETGDMYLYEVAQHILAGVRDNYRKSAEVARLGGDEFGVVLREATREQAVTLADVLLKSLHRKEFVYEGRRLNPFSASIGIVLFPEHGDKPSNLLAKADSAMYMAKERGRNTVVLFEEAGSATAKMLEKVDWEARIRAALRENRFQLYFQPIVDLQTGLISHYETLLRMIGEDQSVIAPGAFIEVAERFGLIREIDQWVVENAIRTQGQSLQGAQPVSLTINLSGRHFGSDQILALIRKSTQQYAANPNSIVFEVTETAAVDNFSAACQFIDALREHGYRFALDDFGSGFSVFNYIKNISLDYVKIDGSFIRNLHKDEKDQVIVKTIADMARGLGIKVVGEFVEHAETVDMLKKLGVPLGQGYFFAKPAPQFLEAGSNLFKKKPNIRLRSR